MASHLTGCYPFFNVSGQPWVVTFAGHSCIIFVIPGCFAVAPYKVFSSSGLICVGSIVWW